MSFIEIRQYRAPDGTVPFDGWLLRLREVAHGYWQDYRARTHERSVPRKRPPAR
jgi:hypothetical protein